MAPAPYYTMLAPRGASELELWDAVKDVAGEIIAAEAARSPPPRRRPRPPQVVRPRATDGFARRSAP
jgi:hypothetical protein